MVMASGRWLGVRLDLVAALLIGTVAMAAVLTSQDPGNYIYILKQLFDKSGVNIDCPVSYGRTSAEGKLTSDQAFFFSEECESIATRESAVWKGEKKERLIQLLHESSAASPESGLLSDWSKNKSL